VILSGKLNPHLAALRGVLDGVADQVVEHIFEQPFVGDDLRQRFFDIKDDGKPLLEGLILVQGNEGFYGLPRINRVQLALARLGAFPAKPEEITDELVEASMESLRKFVLAPCEFCDGASIFFDLARAADAAGYTPDFGPESNRRIVQDIASDLIVHTTKEEQP
jgi:hypothetical protein